MSSIIIKCAVAAEIQLGGRRDEDIAKIASCVVIFAGQ
jgi:hypothetical protein